MNPELRTPLIAGNWKENPGTVNEASDLATFVQRAFLHDGSFDPTGRCTISPRREVVVCPPYPFLDKVRRDLCPATNDVTIGAQDLSAFDEGAHTGEVSGKMVKSLGCDYVIVGHSEIRKAGETNDTVKEKVRAALRNALAPILCVGEKLEERESGNAKAIVTEQLRAALEGLTAEDMAKVVIAYEPVWSIGTGKNAAPEDAESMCSHIRVEVARLFTQAVADKIRILYGGSVKSTNIDSYMAQPNVDGALVGGEALDANKFARIVKFEAPAA